MKKNQLLRILNIKLPAKSNIVKDLCKIAKKKIIKRYYKMKKSKLINIFYLVTSLNLNEIFLFENDLYETEKDSTVSDAKRELKKKNITI